MKNKRATITKRPIQDRHSTNIMSRKEQNFKLLAFDAYGTLCCIASKHQAYTEIIDQVEMGYKKAASLLMTSKLSLVDLFHINSALEQRVAKKIQAELRSVTPFDESLEVLRQVREKGLEIAIVSNLSVPYAEPLKRLFGQYVDYSIFSFAVGYKKPEPEIYNELLAQSSCDANEILMVGDSIKSDIEGARNAGIKSVWLNRNSIKVDGSISTLEEVFEYL
ncbi:hypothetical protein MNBD_GAMMA12-1072 [hydrothermal vent metagenome]|uniref:Uncharacterized protein n=1 Tax=hydrothermal vent metagenome TaxID=652676 RepID=A0A3B0YAE6_9ZZZZ